MSDAVEIPLHADTPPGLAQVFGWVLGANVFVVTTITLVFIILPWLAGHQPAFDTGTLLLAGATGIGLMLGFLFLAFQRHHRKRVGTPSAYLKLTPDEAELRVGGERQHCTRDQFVARPVHAHESLRGVDYYMGPALELKIGEHRWVVAVMDGKHRWGHDPPAVQRIDWICSSEAWSRLLVAEQLDDGLVAYREEPGVLVS